MHQYMAALLRGLIVAVCSFGVSYFTMLGGTDVTKEKALYTSLATAFGTLLVRFGGEGSYDAYRNAKNLVKPGDVTGPPAAQLPPVAPPAPPSTPA